ncbi:MAG: hypothetical protein ACQPRH_04440 [Solitalea-like symbiont of Tyrophagus putrescentiae]
MQLHNINQTYKILDVTLRDGGYKNNFNFSLNEVKDIIKFLQKINVDYIEVGYRNGSFSENKNIGMSGLCHSSYLKYIKNLLTDRGINIAVMLHPKNVSLADIEDMAQAGVNLIRVCMPKTIR